MKKLVFLRKSKPSAPSAKKDDKLEYFRKLIMDHLDTLDGEVLAKAKAMQIGQTSHRKDGEYVKTGKGKWRKKYEGHTRGAKMAIAAIKRKVAAAKDAHEMMQIVLEHRDRFSDKDGHPLPFVQELSKYVSERQDYTPENIKARRKEARSNAIKAGQKKAREKKEEVERAADENRKQKVERMKQQGIEIPQKEKKEEFAKQGERKKNKKGIAYPRDSKAIAEFADHMDYVDNIEVDFKNKKLSVVEAYNKLQNTPMKLKPSVDTDMISDWLWEMGIKDGRNRIDGQDIYDIVKGEKQDPLGDKKETEKEEQEKKDVDFDALLEELKRKNPINDDFIRPRLNIVRKEFRAGTRSRKDAVEYLQTTFNWDSDLAEGRVEKWERELEFDRNNPDHPNAEPIESEEEKHRNRSDAMKGNKNAYKGGPKPQPESERIAEQEETAKARKAAALPPVEKHGRVSSMKDTTWNPKSEDYRYKDTGYIAGSRKEMAQSYIKKMAKTGEQVTNETIDWTGIEENKVAAADIITKQNLLGKLDFEALKSAGLKGGAGYLINEILKTINSRPEKATADNRYNFSWGLDTIRSRLEQCKTLEDVQEVSGEIQGEMTGYYISAKKAPEYMAIAEKKEKLKKKMAAHIQRIKDEVYKAGDPYAEADAFLKNNMDISSGVKYILHENSGKWDGRYYDKRGKDKLHELLEKGQAEYYKREEEIENRIGVNLADMYEAEREIEKEMRKIADEKSAEKHIGNDMSKAWHTFGKSFTAAIDTVIDMAGMNYRRGGEFANSRYLASPTFANYYTEAMNTTDDDFSWAEKKKTGGGKTGPRKSQFELLVADKIVRNGGRDVKVETTEDLKKMYNLRDIQLGNWVANDVKSAKFHVDNMATGLADLADITGIPDNLVSLNGRLAIALGARGHNKFLAHYEPVERVINITKMKGGGSLGHEFFHALDNLIADAMTGGRYNVFLTETGQFDDLNSMQKHILDNLLYYKRMKEKYPNDNDYQSSYEKMKTKAEKAGIKVDKVESSEEHIITVKNVFAKLVTAMMSGAATKTKTITYTKDDIEKAKEVFEKGYNSTIKKAKEANKPLDEVLEDLKYSTYYAYSGRRSRRIKGDELKKLAIAYFDNNPDGGNYDVKTEETTSNYFENSKKLESNPGKPYWSDIKELGARAFSAYLSDKMKERGWENNYLVHAADNNEAYGAHKPYPEGEEREAINAAFDELFRVINESGAIRKAIDIENAWRSVSGKEAAIDEAINGALKFFKRVRQGRAKFEKRKVFLNKSGMEAYRWVGEEITESDLEKSLTYSGHLLEGRTKVQGMDISIENKKGSTRSGTDKDGHEWSCKMLNSYGYIRGTVGVDKDHLDVFIGPNPESEIVYIVNQNDPVTGDFDEQKVMLGFNSEAEAKEAYLKQYDRPGFFGSIMKMDIDTFKEKAFDQKNKGKPLEK